jgi:hypothetical protein
MHVALSGGRGDSQGAGGRSEQTSGAPATALRRLSSSELLDRGTARGAQIEHPAPKGGRQSIVRSWRRWACAAVPSSLPMSIVPMGPDANGQRLARRPRGPGDYLCTVEASNDLRVTYSGRTKTLNESALSI